MGRIPVRFERVAAAFNADVARVSPSENDEHSTDLSYLVKSFMERGGEGEDPLHWDEEVHNLEGFHSEKREMLEQIFCDHGEDAKQKITRQVELASVLVPEKDNSSPQFKRQLVSHLRERGFDAGLCICKWEKNTRFPAGDYEYMDINFAGNRYIVEISLVTKFEIARPTGQYSSLLHVFPPIFVGKLEELKQVVRIMCTAIKGSMKSIDMYIPPWRRIGYMQAKWSSSYSRITDEEVATTTTSLPAFPPRSIEFDARPVKSYTCRDDYGGKPAFRVCHLTTAFYADGSGIIL
ncbi:hypothetical protein VNO78_22501 [Psophocarpus tetragonolobus]|uniref:DUF506 family protein n=1 Tax=Psophocarpus tetragonolobus TaxID=3891 RepID=A0AAN9S2G6_PSOTE